MPHFWAMSSAPWNCDVNWKREKYDFGTALPTFWPMLEPIGTRLMTSTPQARAASTTPPATSECARFVACCDEPHCASTVVAATDVGMPAVSHAVRAMLNDCMPTWLTQPADDLADLGRVDARPLDDRLLHLGEQFGGVDGGQTAAPTTDRGPGGFDDHDLAHVGTLALGPSGWT